MKKPHPFVVALLLGTTQAVHLKYTELAWDDNSFFDKNDAELNKYSGQYSDARHGISKADRAKEARLKKQSDEKTFNHPMFEVPRDIMESDWTGTKYTTTHRCFGGPCKEDEQKKAGAASFIQISQPASAYDSERDAANGYPSTWANEQWPTHDHKDIKEFVGRFIDKKTGALRSEKEVDDEFAAEKEAKVDKELRGARKFQVQDWMINDWSGHKYVTTHRCFGHPCKKDEGLVQLEEEEVPASGEVKEGTYKIGDLQEHRYPNQASWKEGGYPHEAAEHIENVHKMVYERFDPVQGRFKHPLEIEADKAAEEQKRLEDAAKKPAFQVPDSIVNDWTGHKYTTTHRCFGGPCKHDSASFLQLQGDGEIPHPKIEVKEGTYNVGDLQEHRYPYQEAWKEGGLPHHVAQDIENVHKMIYDRFDPVQGRFKHPLEIEVERGIDEDKRLEEASKKPAYKVPDSVVDDWTGHKYTTTHRCFGHPCKDDEEKVQLEDASLLQLDESQNLKQAGSIATDSEMQASLESELSLESEAAAESSAEASAESQAEIGAEASAELSTELGASAEAEATVDSEADPYDPNYSDVDKIIKRYDSEDASKELHDNKISVEGASDGIDKISASSLAHASDEDTQTLTSLFENYASDGSQPGERIVTKWNAQLAAQEAIKNWNDISEAALDKFMKDYFNQAWKKYDLYDREKIDFIEAVPFIRELMSSMTPDPTLDLSRDAKKKVKKIEVDPIVEPDEPVEAEKKPKASAPASAPAASSSAASSDSSKSAEPSLPTNSTSKASSAAQKKIKA